jgi:hypothetical protein
MILNIFFSIKIIRQFRGAKNFQGDKLSKTLPKSIIFQNLGGARAPLDHIGSTTI